MTLKDFRRTPQGRRLRHEFREIEYLAMLADQITIVGQAEPVSQDQIMAWAIAHLKRGLRPSISKRDG